MLLLCQFIFAQNRPKSDISEALGPLHYITIKAFAMTSGDGTKCKTCFGGPRIITCSLKKYFSKIEVWLFTYPPRHIHTHTPVWQKTKLFPAIFSGTLPLSLIILLKGNMVLLLYQLCLFLLHFSSQGSSWDLIKGAFIKIFI